MKLKERLPALAVTALLVGGAVVMGTKMFGGGHAAASATVHVPPLSVMAQPQVSERQMEAIIAYVREMQVANGIVYQEHRM